MVSYFLYDKNYSGMCEFYTHDSRGIVSSSTRYLHEKNCDVLIRDNELIKIFHRVQEKEGFISFAKYVTGVARLALIQITMVQQNPKA